MVLSGLMEGHVFIPVLLGHATQPIFRCKSRVQEVHLCHRYNQHRDCIDCYHSKRVCRRKNSTEDGPGQYHYLGAFTQKNQQTKVHKIIRNIRGDAEDPGIMTYCTMLCTFLLYSKVIQLYIHIHSFSIFFSIMVYHRIIRASSIQFSRSVISDSLRPHESQHTRPPCPTPTPGVQSDSHPSSQ